MLSHNDETRQPIDRGSFEPGDYSSEIRFGVVMYGGVSLAIYINGVANELFEMACATPRRGVILGGEDRPGTREIYQRLACLMGNPELREYYAARIAERRRETVAEASEATDVWDEEKARNYQQTRLVIDVIAGTSAGGINGVFLAKALANGEKFDSLKDMWVTEGDIGLLLNDKRSYRTAVPPLDDRSDTPKSLLNSDRMYAKLLVALKGMEKLNVKSCPHNTTDISPLADEIDLFVTTTDIEGAAVPLRLFDQVVYERRHKQSYHFRYPNGVTEGGNDFRAINLPFLAFASRCTSSFPFAFEPMTLSAVQRLKEEGPTPGIRRWDIFFPQLPPDEVADGAHVNRAFGDGGYLDNKPFSYVVDTLSARFSSVPIERKLMYVEPSPVNIDPHQRPDPGNPPDALSNSIAAMTRIPQYETIREDLQTVLLRNRRIERVERIVRNGESDVENYGERDPFKRVLREGGKIPEWLSLKLSDMARFYGLAFLPYQRLRVSSITDTLADQLGQRWGINLDSDSQYALRALVRVWREKNYDSEGTGGRETMNAFLDQFDLDYRLRRLGFLLRKIDLLLRLFRRRQRGTIVNLLNVTDAGKPPPLNETDTQIAEQVSKRLPLEFSPLNPALDDTTLELALRALGELKSGLIEVRLALLQARRSLGKASPGDPANDPTLRRQLKAMLKLVLGDKSSTKDPVELALMQGGSTDVMLDPSLDRVASSSRTLQESVFQRARALIEAAARGGRTQLQEAVEASLEPMRVKHSPHHAGDQLTPLNKIARRAWELLGQPMLMLDNPKDLQSPVIVKVQAAASRSGDEARDARCQADLNSEMGTALRRFLGDYYVRFDSFDQISFPLYYDTGTGEPSTVEIVRVSPQDATHLIDEAKVDPERRKLAGTKLGHFGAFLDRRWRLNDIMWGRLDGAERIIQVLLPMSDPATITVREELIALAHGRILRQALVPDGQRELTDLLCKALEAINDGDSSKDEHRPNEAKKANNEKVRTLLDELLIQLKLGDGPSRERLSNVLASLLSEQGLIDFVRNKRKIDPEPDPKSTLDSAARAVTITGRVLEGISTHHGANSALPRWLARLGLLLQGIVAVSLPDTLKHRWWSHGVKVLYAFEIVMLMLALIFGSGDMRTLAITALGATFGIHLLTIVTGDFMQEGGKLLKALLIALMVTLIVLAGIGAKSLLQAPSAPLPCCTLDSESRTQLETR